LFVGDRGMITQANAEKLKDTEGLRMISALTHKQIVALLERKVITPELFDEHKIVEMVDPDKPTRRYELCRNPLTANRETQTRKSLLDLTRKELEKIAGARKRSSSAKIGSRVGRVLQKYKMGKFVKWETKDGRLIWHFDEDKIAAELLLDGCYVIWTDIKPELMEAVKVVESYKKLQQVEIAIRNLKTVLLEVRPVFHKKDDRICAHVFLCMLADHVQWHMKKRLQPLFDDDGVGKDREWTFANVVERLKAIRREKRTVADVSFLQTTVPAEDQQRILDLLKVTM
jgi:transposase